MTAKEVAAMLKVLRRNKVVKFQMDHDTIAVEFPGAGSSDETHVVGFQIEQEEEDGEEG